MSNQTNNLNALAWSRDGLMVSAHDSGSSCPGFSPGWELSVVFLGETLTSHATTRPLSTQVYKWVSTNLMLGVTLRWTSFPFRKGVKIPLVASCYRNRR